MEPYRNYYIVITLADGDTMVVQQLARSEWEAKDKAFSKHSHIQGDRLKYRVKRPMLNLS